MIDRSFRPWPWLRTFTLASFAAALAGSLTPQAAAQQSGNVFLPAPRVLRQHLARADRAMEEARYGDAVSQLGHLLSDSSLASEQLFDDELQDFFVGTLEQRGQSGVHTSLKSEAEQMLAEMPSQARELYELQFGGDARALLEAAVREADMEKLSEVVRKYFHTDAGYEAMVLLGRLHLDHGRPLAAALCFRRLVETPAASKQYDPELSVLLAACWHYAERPEEARETMSELRERFPRAELNIGQREADRLPRGSEALAWLEDHFGTELSHDGRVQSDWPLYRGNAARNAQTSGEMPLSTFRWKAPTSNDPTDGKLIEQLRAGHLNQGVPALPGLHPLVVNDTVVMRTPERVLGIDFETGKRIWKYPWWDLPRATTSVQRGTPNDEVQKRKQQLLQRLWHDAPYGQISSDGEAIYMLAELRYAHQGQSNPQWFPRPGRGRQRNPDTPESHNELVALNLAREGALRWKVGGETGLDEPKLAGAFFLGPPLPLMDQLFVLAELKGEIRLIVLDRRTGKCKWSQQLAHVDTSNILRDRMRRLAGATPSFGDGVLICPTSAGAVVAVDLSTRRLLWGKQYEPLRIANQFGRPHSRAGRAPRAGDRWADASPTVLNGKVLLTPVESDKLFCLDLLTGEPAWPPLERKGELAGMQYVAGEHAGSAILVGHRGVVAIRLADGEPAWSSPVQFDQQQGEMPSGRGYQSGRHYFLPTTNSELIKLDLEEGEIVEREKTDEVLGNLVCYKDQVIAQSPTSLATFYQIEPLRRRVAERLDESPDDPWALARQGELLIHDGKPKEALESLRRAFEVESENEAVRVLLVDTFLTALRQDFAGHQEIATDLEDLIERPERRIEYLRLMAVGLHESGALNEAADAYLELAALSGERFGAEDSSQRQRVEIDDQLSVRVDRWLHGRLRELYGSAEEPLREKLAAAVTSRMGEAIDGSLQDLQRFLAFYGFHPETDPARIKLVQRYLGDQRYLEAEVVCNELVGRGDGESPAAAFAMLAEALAEAGRFELAAEYYRQLNDKWADVDTAAGKTGSQLYETAREEPDLQQALADSDPWPWGRVETSSSSRAADRSFQRVVPVPVQAYTGVVSRDLTVTYDGGATSSLVARDGDGRVKVELPLNDSRVRYQLDHGMNYSRLFGHLLLTVLGDQVVAADLFRGADEPDEAILWREPFLQTVPNISNQRDIKHSWQKNHPFDPEAGNVFFVKDSGGQPVGRLGPVTSKGLYYLKSRTLVCVDPVSGETLWERKNVRRGSAIFGDEQHIYVAARTSREALVLDAVDGREVGRRKTPPWDLRWTTLGRHVLAWQEEDEDEGTRLYLYDIDSEREIWSETFSHGARGCLIAASQVAVMQPDGRFMIRSLLDDQVLVDAQLEPETQLSEIHVLPSRGQYLLVTNNSVRAKASSDVSYKPVTGGMPAPMIHGRVYAFDRASGQQQWQTPAVIENYGLPVDQPHELPTLWFIRHISTKQSRRSARASDQTSVLCLDRRDGRILLADDAIPTKTNTYQIVPDRLNDLVRLELPGHTRGVRFTDQPVPPEPPAQTGKAASAAPDANGDKLSRVAESLLDTILGADKESSEGDP